MITVGGHRNAVAREDAVAVLHEAGVEDPGAALDRLVNGRLLAAEDLGGLQRLEITHDVLAPLAVRSREQRRARERAVRAETEEREAKAREAAARRQRARLRWLAVGRVSPCLGRPDVRLPRISFQPASDAPGGGGLAQGAGKRPVELRSAGPARRPGLPGGVTPLSPRQRPGAKGFGVLLIRLPDDRTHARRRAPAP